MNNPVNVGVAPAVRAAVSHLPAPFNVLDLDAALANAQDMTSRAQTTPIRLASKSLRIPELMRRVLALPGYQGVLAFSVAEALWLVSEGFRDIVVAYPCANPELLRAVNSDPVAREEITLMVDSVEHVEFIARHVEDPQLRLCLDIDASLEVGPAHIGALRSPVHSAAQAVVVAQEIIRRRGLRLVGLMAYEGQIAGTTDTSPAVAVMKALSVRELAKRRAAVVKAVSALVDLEFVNGGGTGSIETTRAEEAITEIGAGSGIIGPALFDNYRQFTPQPAHWFVLPVVRRPAPDVVTIAGGGRIASGAIGKDRLPVVDFPTGLHMSALEGAGEVQTPLRGAAAANLQLGDHVWFRHAKAGEGAEWANHVVVVSNGEILGHWDTYRGLGKSFV